MGFASQSRPLGGSAEGTTGPSLHMKEAPVATPLIPIKTPDGQAELSNRQRRLSQRHRTVLLLVDGRRSEHQVRQMAQQAGAAESCFGELIEMGLIAMPQTPEPQRTVPMPRPPAEDEPPLHVDIPIEPHPPVPAPPPSAPPSSMLALGGDSLLPAARTLQPESVLDDSLLRDSRQADESLIEDFDALESAATEDTSLEEARDILLRAVRREAPLTGSLTMLKLRRARSRGELADLIDEVESRIIKPYRSLAAQQVLRRARHLLTARVDSAQPAT